MKTLRHATAALVLALLLTVAGHADADDTPQQRDIALEIAGGDTRHGFEN